VFQFSCRFAFLSTFLLSNWTPKNVNFDPASSKRANFDEIQFFKHTPKLIIFGTHNLRTCTHNILINELLLMLFYYLIFALSCITGSDENCASHSL